MAREESYKDFFRFLSFCPAFFKIETIAVLVNMVLFTICYSKYIQDYGLTESSQKSLTI